MKRDKFLYQHHVMWYEIDMVLETLDSVYSAYMYSKSDVEFRFCINLQTYLEKPEVGSVRDRLDVLLNHPIIKISDVTWKTDLDPFYNIGDWRREIYDPSYKYTIWGESDCLMPNEFFSTLEEVDSPMPHILSFSSRKMWDSSWDIVEHKDLEKIPRKKDNPYQAPYPLNSSDIITIDQLNEFNSAYKVELITSSIPKVDGSLLCISGGILFKFIPDDMHFVREDTCAELSFRFHGIPQIIVKSKIKGHNYSHPLKRKNVIGSRSDSLWKKYEKKSTDSMYKFINELRSQQHVG